MKITGSNPFGANTRLAAASKTVSKDEGKKIDLVGIYLASVPSLQKAKEELEKLRSSMVDEANCSKCDLWVKQIIAIMTEILDHTKVAIQGEIEEASPTKGPGSPITADMISGKQEVPAGTLRQPPAA